jgi:hypothetical protein
MLRTFHDPVKIVVQLLGMIVILVQVILFSHFQLVVIVRALHYLGKALTCATPGFGKNKAGGKAYGNNDCQE